MTMLACLAEGAAGVLRGGLRVFPADNSRLWCHARSALAFDENNVDCSGPAEPHAGAQEFLRIDGIALDASLIMQMRAG